MAPWCYEPCPTCGRETRHWFDLATQRPDFLRCVCEVCGAAVVLVDGDASGRAEPPTAPAGKTASPQEPNVVKVGAPPWHTAVKAAVFWILLGGALSGLFALMDELRLPQPFDDLAEALVVIVPLSLPAVAGICHRSWRIALLLAAALLAVGLCFVGFTVLEMMRSGGRWAR